MNRVPFFLLFSALVFMMTLAPALSGAAPSKDAMSGTWKIDVDETLKINWLWKQAYDPRSAEEQATMYANWLKKSLVLDLRAHTLVDQNEGGKTQTATITEVHNHGEGLRITVRPSDSAPVVVDLLLLGADSLKLSLEENDAIVLKRLKKPE